MATTPDGQVIQYDTVLPDVGLTGSTTNRSTVGMLTYDQWLAANPLNQQPISPSFGSNAWSVPGAGDSWTQNPEGAYKYYTENYQGPIPETTDAPQWSADEPVQVTPGSTNAPNQMNVVDYSGRVVGDPQRFFTTDNPDTPDLNESMFLSQRNQTANVDANGTNLINQQAYQNVGNANGTNSATVQSDQVNPQDASTYQADSSVGAISANQTEAAQGQISQQGQIDPNVGQAEIVQGQAAQQDLNTVDPRATIKGQLGIMQSDWVDPDTGEPKIPIYAQAAARSVSKIAAFKGMTGTAATQALSTALQEAQITVATADAQFFQTLTLKNLDNRQQTAINNANILANMNLQNADNRLAAAIENSQQFLKMDLANLNNRQQANVLDSQARIQSILSSSAEENVARRFNAESTNDMAKFYDELNSQINQFNASLEQNNNQFNSTLADSRQKWYGSMQYQIDQSNAEWRRNVTLTEDAQSYDAAKQDVTNMVAISNEMLNQIWDRSDSLLDYLWKTSDNTKQRDHELVLQKLKTQAELDAAREGRKAANDSAIGKLVGTVIGDSVTGLVGSIFGF